jgi:hypothetical protein
MWLKASIETIYIWESLMNLRRNAVGQGDMIALAKNTVFDMRVLLVESKAHLIVWTVLEVGISIVNEVLTILIPVTGLTTA